jgi:hypothetical protein
LEDRLTPSTVMVTSGADSGSGTLRAALASSAFSGEIIDFAANVRTIDLTSAGLTISTNVTIQNDLGTGPVTIDGGGQFTVFTVSGGMTASLSGLVITNGTGTDGGGINNHGTLTVSKCTVSSNSATDGGGIFSDGNKLTVNDSTFSGNTATDGGAILNDTMTMVSDSTFSGNTATDGGGILSDASIEVGDSTFSGNTATDGGAILNDAPTLTVNDCTISGNRATGGPGSGGGIENDGGATLNGTIVAGNFNGASPSTTADDLDGTFNSISSHNLIGTGGGGLTNNNGNQVDVSMANVGLSPLGNYGGPTETMILLPGSFALNAGQTETNAFDQRGFARPNGAPGDVGAVQDRVATLDVNTTATTESTADTLLSLRDALELSNGTFTLSQMTPQAQAQVTGTPGDIDTINLIAETYVYSTADNYWYGPNALPAISSAVTINGNGAVLERDPSLGLTTADSLRFFYVSGGLSGLAAGQLNLNNLTLENGFAKGGDSDTGGGGLGAGGAIFNQGALALTGVTLTDNVAQGGSSNVSGLGSGGGGMGQDATTGNGAGFGGAFPGGSGGAGGAGNTSGDGGGGGGFSAPGESASNGGYGGGLSSLGGSVGLKSANKGDGGAGALVFGGAGVGTGGAGGAFGSGGSVGVGSAAAGGGGGVGGGGGAASGGLAYGGAGGFGGGGGFGNSGGFGGFGGGGGGSTSNPHPDAQGGDGLGGAVFSMYGTVTVVDSTFTNNDADGGLGVDNSPGSLDPGSGAGGAIFNLDGSLSLSDDTLAADSVSGNDFSNFTRFATGGVELYNLAFGATPTGSTANATVTVVNSILGAAADPTGGLFNNTNGSASGLATVNEAGPNIIPTSFSLGTGTGITGTTPLTSNPMLAVLGSYGGLTQTMAVLPGSPAIDAGSNAAIPTGTTTDQRGAPRIFNVTVDLGAFEGQGYTLTATNTPQSANVNTAFALPLQVTLTENFAHDPLPGATIVFLAPASGASATFSSPAVTNANGQTSVTATANGIAGGPYNVTAEDAGPAADKALFSLTNAGVGLAPTVIDPTDTSITQTAATLGGDVTNGGSASVTARGVVYSLTSVNADPVRGGAGVTDLATGGTTGVFTVSATGLTPDTMYSFAAYATNGVGTTYTSPVTTFVTLVAPTAPTVINPTDTSVTATTASLGGDVTSDGNATITARGVVYSVNSVNANPHIGGTGVINLTTTGTTGVFVSGASGLTPDTTYSFAAYATNSVGTTYTSPATTFTTELIPIVSIDKGYTVALENLAGGNVPLPIDPTQLMATESDLSATQLTYTVKVLPLYGVLAKSGAPLGVGGTFTQSDIDNGLVTFQNTDVADAAPTGVTTSFAFTVTDPDGNSTAQQSFVINFGRVKATSSVTDGSGNLFDYIQFENGTVYRTPPFALPLQQVVATPTIAISAGTDNNKNADLTVEYAGNDSLWTYSNKGATQLVFAQESAMGHTPLSFVAGLNGVVDVVFSDHELWQANLTRPASPTLITANVKFVSIGAHGTGASAVEADYVAFLDSGNTNGGVWEHYVVPGSGAHWLNVTSLDVYAISASQDLSDTADLIVSNRNNAGIVDHQVYGWRGVVGSLTEVTGMAVLSVAIDAAGNDYYVLQSTGGLYEHKEGVPLSTPATPIITPHPTSVASVAVANGQTNVLDVIFANVTYWQVSGITSGEYVFKQVAT